VTKADDDQELYTPAALFQRKPTLPVKESGFGGLVVSMLASGSRVRGLKPEAVGFF
jgi:hypothetical protein